MEIRERELLVNAINNDTIGTFTSKASETAVPSCCGDKTWFSTWKNGFGFRVVSVTGVIRDTCWRAQGQEGAQYLARVVFYRTTTHYGWHKEICATSTGVHEIPAKLQGCEERVGKERARGVEKTRFQGCTDVHQVCGISLRPTMFSHVVPIGKMVWQSIGKCSEVLPEDPI